TLPTSRANVAAGMASRSCSVTLPSRRPPAPCAGSPASRPAWASSLFIPVPASGINLRKVKPWSGTREAYATATTFSGFHRTLCTAHSHHHSHGYDRQETGIAGGGRPGDRHGDGRCAAAHGTRGP